MPDESLKFCYEPGLFDYFSPGERRNGAFQLTGPGPHEFLSCRAGTPMTLSGLRALGGLRGPVVAIHCVHIPRSSQIPLGTVVTLRYGSLFHHMNKRHERFKRKTAAWESLMLSRVFVPWRRPLLPNRSGSRCFRSRP